MTKIKICGITRPEDAAAAADLGADAVGLVFYDKSPRAVDIKQANDIISFLPPFITVVGLFVNPEKNFVNNIIDNVSLNLLQFHGDETVQFCEQFHMRYLKALHVKQNMQPNEILYMINKYPTAAGILLDTFSSDAKGGTGKCFNWHKVPQSTTPIILAGGLNGDNIVNAVMQVRPYGVDVSSGVEILPGVKDKDKIATFIRGVHSVKCS